MSYTSNPMVGKCDNGERIPPYVAVVLESRYVRSTPIYGDIVGTCYEGAVVIVVHHEKVDYSSPRARAWAQAQVLLPDGMLGWICAAALRPLKL